MSTKDAFVRWFQQATGNEPYPFQVCFACEPTLPELVDVPTGLGKTAMAVLGWLWRRRFGLHGLSGGSAMHIDWFLGER